MTRRTLEFECSGVQLVTEGDGLFGPGCWVCAIAANKQQSITKAMRKTGPAASHISFAHLLGKIL
jgi:hypothetical protein